MKILPNNIFYLFLFVLQISFSQTKISGNISNKENLPISRANIQLLDKDSISINYSFSNDKGNYELFAPENGEYLLKITAFNFEKRFKKILVNNELKENFNLDYNNNYLDAVIIIAKEKVAKIRWDSISYNLKTIKDGTERNLGDLVKKLPGLEIDENGKVKFQGTTIEKILIDGNDFFGNKHQIATENISSDMIEGIDLLLKHQTDTNLKDFSTDTKTVLNVKLKEKYRGETVGNFGLYGGYIDKYLGHTNLFKFSKKGNISFISDFNNIGESPMSVQDYIELIGGINTILAKTETNSSGITDIDELIPKYIYTENKVKTKKNYFSALNYTYKFSKKIKVNGNLLFNKTDQTELLNTQKLFISSSNPTEINEFKSSRSNNYLTSSYLNLDYTPNQKTSINYNALYNPTNGTVNENLLNGNNNFQNWSKNTGESFGQQLKIIKRINENLLFRFNINHSISNLSNSSTISSDSDFLNLQFENNVFTVLKSSNFKSSNLGFNSSIVYKKNKDSYKLIISNNFQEEIIDSEIEKNVVNYLDFANKLSSKTNNFITNLKFANYFSKYMIQYGLVINSNKIKTSNNRFDIINFEPNISLNYELSVVNRISISYLKTHKKPSLYKTLQNNIVEDYQTIIKRNDLQLFQFSPTDNYTFSFNNFNSKKQQSFTLNLNYSISKNSNTTNSNYTNSFVETYNLISANEKNLYGFFLFDKKMDFCPIFLKSSLSFNQTEGNNYISDIQNTYSNSRTIGSIKLLSNFKESKFQAHFNYLVDNFYTKQSINNISSNTINQQFILNILGVLKHSKFDLNTTLLIQKSKTHNQNQFILSPTYTYFSKNNKWEFSALTQNILNLTENKYLTQSNTNYYIENNELQTLTGSVLIGMKYNL